MTTEGFTSKITNITIQTQSGVPLSFIPVIKNGEMILQISDSQIDNINLKKDFFSPNYHSPNNKMLNDLHKLFLNEYQKLDLSSGGCPVCKLEELKKKYYSLIEQCVHV